MADGGAWRGRESLLARQARESFGLIALSEPQIDGGAGLISFRLVQYPCNAGSALKPACEGHNTS